MVVDRRCAVWLSLFIMRATQYCATLPCLGTRMSFSPFAHSIVLLIQLLPRLSLIILLLFIFIFVIILSDVNKCTIVRYRNVLCKSYYVLYCYTYQNAEFDRRNAISYFDSGSRKKKMWVRDIN